MDLLNANRFTDMYVFIIAQVLEINFLNFAALITALITIVGALWAVFSQLDSKVPKTIYYLDKDSAQTQFKELEKKVMYEIDCLDQKNIGSHGEIKAESHEYFRMLREDMKEERKEVNRKLDVIMEMVKDRRK